MLLGLQKEFANFAGSKIVILLISSVVVNGNKEDKNNLYDIRYKLQC